jgi:hypothetical protein
MAAKSSTIKGAGGKFGGCALKAVSLIAGDLPSVFGFVDCTATPNDEHPARQHHRRD